MTHYSPHTLGPVKLADGVTTRHGIFFLITAFLGVSLTTFVSIFQPYLLTVHLDLPNDQMGKVTGAAIFAGECVLLVSSSLVGALSDRIGRRRMFAIGGMIIAAGWIAFAYISTVAALIAARMFISIGFAVVNVMVAALMADYPAEESRGKLVALGGIAIGLGQMMVGVLFMRIPGLFADTGASELMAGRYTLFFVAGVTLFLAAAAGFGLKPGKPEKSDEHEPLRKKMAMGVRVGIENPRVLLAYFSAFVARGDLVVIGTFMTLWITQFAIGEGLTPEQAAKESGIIFGMVMGFSLAWAPVMGWLNDRMDRVQALALAMFLATIGYFAVSMVPDPMGIWMWPAAALLGIGQISVITSSQTLIGQESPAAYRGAVVGMFSMFGAAGILFISSVGGWVFDAISPVAPLVVIGFANFALFVAAIIIARKPVPTVLSEIAVK